MADRYSVAVDTDYNPDQVVYDVVDNDTRMYFEASYSFTSAHDRAKSLNDGSFPHDYFYWKLLPNG